MSDAEFHILHIVAMSFGILIAICGILIASLGPVVLEDKPMRTLLVGITAVFLGVGVAATALALSDLCAIELEKS